MNDKDNNTTPPRVAAELDALAVRLAGDVATCVAEALVAALGPRIDTGPSPNLAAASAASLARQFTCGEDFECWNFKCPKEINCSKAFDCVFTFTGLKLQAISR